LSSSLSEEEAIVNSRYGFGTTLQISNEEATLRVKDALKAEGFGVLTEIDVRKTLHEKLGSQMEPYLILGACNPVLAQRALEQESDRGLLLPCNVVIRAVDDGCRVEIADPEAMLGIVGSKLLDTIAEEAKQRLQRVVIALERKASGDSTATSM
jgi:uncharacterized protein (DUF302 family)